MTVKQLGCQSCQRRMDCFFLGLLSLYLSWIDRKLLQSLVSRFVSPNFFSHSVTPPNNPLLVYLGRGFDLFFLCSFVCLYLFVSHCDCCVLFSSLLFYLLVVSVVTCAVCLSSVDLRRCLIYQQTNISLTHSLTLSLD